MVKWLCAHIGHLCLMFIAFSLHQLLVLVTRTRRSHCVYTSLQLREKKSRSSRKVIYIFFSCHSERRKHITHAYFSACSALASLFFFFFLATFSNLFLLFFAHNNVEKLRWSCERNVGASQLDAVRVKCDFFFFTCVCVLFFISLVSFIKSWDQTSG